MPWRTDDGHDGPPLSGAVAVNAHAWLLKNFGEPWRMVEGWIVFGHEQSNRFDFIFNEDRSVNLSARVDVRSNFGGFVAAVCELASTSQCVLFSAEHWAVIEPSPEQFSAAIRRCRAAGYVNDPGSVLRGGHGGG